MSKEHKQHARLVRQQRFDEIIHLAQKASAHHNMFELFHLINRFSPKQPRRRMQLRNTAGQLASPVEEHSIMCQYVQEMWSDDPMTLHSASAIPGTPFSIQDVYQALAKIPVTKAVAPGFAPGLVWRAHANTLAPYIYNLLCTWWNLPDPVIPQTWKDGWMSWLPKPGRAPVCPASLRPIALQEPIGKAMIGMLSRIGQTESLDSMIVWPLWAYLPHRSTQDSILRVASHCRQARQLLQTQRSTPISRSQGVLSFPVCGAVQLFIDLSRAFDTINRSHLFSRLHSLGVSPSITKLIMHWHHNTRYVVRTCSSDTPIAVYKGVRQGCKAAPWLWNSIMTLLLTDLSQSIPPQWIKDHVNLYADDSQAGSLFYSESEFQQVLHYFGCILSTLREYGLIINQSKSHVLLVMTGSASRKCRQRHTTWHNGKEWLHMKASDTFSIPIDHEVKYLGTIMCYHNLEDRTMQHRIQLAKIAYGRLAKWLLCRRGLAIKSKLQLWHSCILPIITYGIFPVGVTYQGLQSLAQLFHKMLRQIVRDHPYRTGHTNAQTFDQHGLPHPYILVWHCADRLHTSVTRRCFHLQPHDIVLTLNWQSLHDLKELLLNMHCTGPPSFDPAESSEVPTHATLFCKLCNFTTSHPHSMRCHYTQKHQRQLLRSNHAPLHSFMVDGLPICKYCHRTFTTWRSFSNHVERGCQVHQLHPPGLDHPHLQTMATPFAVRPSKADVAIRGSNILTATDLQNLMNQEWGPRLLTLVNQKQWHNLRHEHAALDYLAQRCCLCNQWVGRAQELHKHLRLNHPQFWPNVMTKSTQFSNQWADETPCPYCKCVFYSKHCCNTWTQVSLLLLYGAGMTQIQSSDEALKCELCDLQLPDAEALHTHLTTVHQLVSARWNPSRDTLDGHPSCAHCGQIFNCMTSLRSHISQSRCPFFDPTLTSEPKVIHTDWIAALCKGSFYDVLADSQKCRQLTLECQCCHFAYNRAADLALHLQSSHPSIWNASEKLTRLLTGMLYGLFGCVCQPAIAVHRTNHVCLPIRQLSMQFCRLPEKTLFMPFPITELMLSKASSDNLPRDLKFALDKFLTDRNLEDLLKNDSMMHQLGQTCVLCATHHAPADLCLHLREAHQCSTLLVSFFVQQLIPWMTHHNTVDHQCFACHQVFNLPQHIQLADGTDVDADELNRRLQLAQSHFRSQCPCTLQLAIVLSLALNDGRLHHDGRIRRISTDPGNIPEPCAPSPERHGQESPPGTKPGTTEKGKKRRKLQGQGKDTFKDRSPGHARTTSADPDPYGQAPSQTGQRDPSSEKRGHLHLLFQQQRASRNLAMPSTDSGTMAHLGQSDAQAHTLDSTEAETRPGALCGLDDKTDSVERSSPGIQAAAGGTPESGAAPGPAMPLLGMGSCTEKPEGEPTHSLDSGQDDPEHSGGDGHVCGEQPDPQFPCIASFGPHHPLETPGEHSSRSRIWPSPGLMRLEHLGSDGNQHEDALATTKWTGHSDCEATPTGRQGQRETPGQETLSEHLTPADRVRLLHALAHAKLGNPNNWCFANSTVIALLWSTLNVSDFSSESWGTQSNALIDFINGLISNTGFLDSQSWFSQVLQSWGRSDLAQLRGSISQHDAAEFVSHWLDLLGTSVVDMGWERRVQHENGTFAVDRSSSSLPLFLQFDRQTMQQSSCELSLLVKLWHQADGMVASLTSHSQCICIHLDRCVQYSASDPVTKCSTKLAIEHLCPIPVFQGEGLQFEFTHHRVAGAPWW